MTTVASATTMKPARALDLETRVANRKRDMITEIVELKKTSRLGAAETIDRLKAQLSELARIVADGAAAGAVDQRKLDDWMAK
jgi:prephenate dehydrogenase|nr:hypothetical protein [Kofleriaceae bacterium]